MTRRPCTPASASRIESGTPVHSLQLARPCAFCASGAVLGPHSLPLFPAHSTKWMRETEGSRRISSMVSISGRSTMPWMRQPVRGGVDLGNAGMVALEVERRRRDDAVGILQRRRGGADLRVLPGAGQPRGFLEGRALAVSSERLPRLVGSAWSAV